MIMWYTVVAVKKKTENSINDIYNLVTIFNQWIFLLLHAAMQNNVLPSKPAFKSTRRYGDKKNVHLSPVDSIHNTPSRSTTPPARTSPSHKANSASLKKWSSLSTTTELNDGSVKPFR